MKTTGWALREALKQQELRRDTAARAFLGTLKKFPDEQKQTPESVVEQLLAAEEAVAQIQVAQARYNLAVTVQFMDSTITLCEAVKRIGGIGRAEKMWRQATGSKPDRYHSYGNADDVRDPTQVRAVVTITPQDAATRASAVAKLAGRLRAAIATANSKEVDIENLSAALFE